MKRNTRQVFTPVMMYIYNDIDTEIHDPLKMIQVTSLNLAKVTPSHVFVGEEWKITVAEEIIIVRLKKMAKSFVKN